MPSPILSLMTPEDRSGRWSDTIRAMADLDYRNARMDAGAKAVDGEERTGRRPYTVQGAAAVIPVYGPLSKDPWIEFFGGSSSVRLEQAIRTAAADPDVGSIFLRIDSPGGDVAGTEELGLAVWEARKAGVPVFAHIEDLGASAAYWVASQAETITANETAEVGSIGTLLLVPDTKEAWADMGVTWHVVASPPGKYKGLLVPSAGISEKALEYAQEQIDPLTESFKAAVMRGRGQSAKWADSVAIGRVWSAPEAFDLGLIDAVSPKQGAFMAAHRAGEKILAERGSEAARRVGRRALDLRNRRRAAVEAYRRIMAEEGTPE